MTSSTNPLSRETHSPEIAQDRLMTVEKHLQELKAILKEKRSDYGLYTIQRWLTTDQLFYLTTSKHLRQIVTKIFGWRFAGFLIGTTLVTGAFVILTFSWLGGLFGVIVGGLFSFCLMFIPQDAKISNMYVETETKNKELSARCTTIKDKINEIIIELANGQKQYSELCETIKQTALKASKEYKLQQLAKKDWKSLRSVPFENFLEEVFTELGYTVETTKITGDQGADLIVSYSGHKIAIQVKGYFNSVSNSAVQEAFTAKSYYACEACAVITNSRFTSSAKELASKINCTLIDEEILPALIIGKYDLWKQYSLLMPPKYIQQDNV